VALANRDRRHPAWVAVAVLIVVAGCASRTPSQSAPPSGQVPTASATSGVPSTPPSPTSTPPVDGGPGPLTGGTDGGAILTEVRFRPRSGETAFMEIGNASPVPVGLAGLVLRLDGRDVAVAGVDSVLPAGEVRVVLFDGADRAEPGVVHAPPGVVPSVDGGVIELRDGTGADLDRVAWGSGPDAVSTGPGGIVPPETEAGATIGRPPGAVDPFQRLDWVVYDPAGASPAAPNPLPRVDILLPLDGAILDEPDPALTWYPVVGAATYRVQVATEPTFGTPTTDVTVSDAELAVGSLPAGTYHWRVASIAGNGIAAVFSEPSAFTLETTASASVTNLLARPSEPRVVTVAATAPRRLPVPYLTQHKDTRMLLLESPVEHGAHAWDVDHGRPSSRDPADTKNCAIAAVAIMNHFFGGDLSQDRLGYEILHARDPGPETDLMYGTGLTVLDATRMLDFALGGGVTVVPAYFSWDDFWRDVKSQIDAGRPVMAANSHHTFVITGYTIENGHRIVYVSDPANGRYRRDLDATTADPQDHSLWITPANPVGRHQEAGVTADADGDGVVDFDETQRFHTDPGNDDSDADELPDKQDIVTGVFDPQYGYAFFRGDAGRDFDGDGLPTERDKDSDAGACWDGEEDEDASGHRNGRETYNFDTSDDVCLTFRVKITWNETYQGRTDSFTFEGVIDTVDPDAQGDAIYMTGTGTVRGSRAAWAACSVDIAAPSGTSPAMFGATIVDETVTIGAFASDGVLLGVNTNFFEMPLHGGTQFFTGNETPGFCPHSWSAKVEVEALAAH
jgi:hypothetical protein